MTSRIRVIAGDRQIYVTAELANKIQTRHLLSPKDPLWFPAEEVSYIEASATPRWQTDIELKGNQILCVTEYSNERNMWKFLIVSKTEVPF